MAFGPAANVVAASVTAMDRSRTGVAITGWLRLPYEWRHRRANA
jgi:hypothetical protein